MRFILECPNCGRYYTTHLMPDTCECDPPIGKRDYEVKEVYVVAEEKDDDYYVVAEEKDD